MVLQLTKLSSLSYKQYLGLKKFDVPFTVAVKELQLFDETTIAFIAGVIDKDDGPFLIVPQLSFTTI